MKKLRDLAYADLFGRVVSRLDHLVSGLVQRVKRELVRSYLRLERLVLLQLTLFSRIWCWR